MAGKPKPTNLKVLEGNRGRRKLPDEPKPRPVVPDPPSWLDTRAKKLWRDLAPKIERLGLLTEVDIESFTALCQAWSRLLLVWRRLKQAERTLNRGEREIHKVKKGEDIGREAEEALADIAGAQKELAFFMKEERLYMQVFRMKATEFGLTPRGRAGLAVNTTDPDEGADLLT